eukprot:gene16009-17625_t
MATTETPRGKSMAARDVLVRLKSPMDHAWKIKRTIQSSACNACWDIMVTYATNVMLTITKRPRQVYARDANAMQENEQSKCVPCNCNGNSVPGMAPICDWKTGVCIACWPNTTGSHCEKCAHGYKGDALNAKNCTAIPIGSGSSSSYTKKVVIALVTSLLVITLGFMVVAVLIWWRKKKSREPLGFVTITMNHVDEDDYNISWIDPVTGDPIHHNEVNTELPNGGLELIDEYEDHVGEFESNDTDRML